MKPKQQPLHQVVFTLPQISPVLKMPPAQLMVLRLLLLKAVPPLLLLSTSSATIPKKRQQSSKVGNLDDELLKPKNGET